MCVALISFKMYNMSIWMYLAQYRLNFLRYHQLQKKEMFYTEEKKSICPIMPNCFHWRRFAQLFYFGIFDLHCARISKCSTFKFWKIANKQLELLLGVLEIVNFTNVLDSRLVEPVSNPTWSTTISRRNDLSSQVILIVCLISLGDLFPFI